jgi:hypothetical protein
MRKEQHWKKHQRHIPYFPERKCPLFQYNTITVTDRDGNKLCVWKEINLPKWRFPARSLKGEGLEHFIDWTIEQLTHESLHLVVHEVAGFDVSVMLD